MKIFNIIAGCASIASFIFSILFLFIKNENCAYIALICFAIFLVTLLGTTITCLARYAKKKYPEGYVMDFVVLSYEVINAQTHRHDLYKIIQSKRPFLYSIYHGFSWSGTKQPKISSDLQTIGELKKGTKQDPFDRVELILKKPLLYNETTTAHFHADMDDTDGRAKPFLNFAVNVPMTMISYKVILRDKPAGFSSKAIVEKIPTREGSIRTPKQIAEVCFDSETKSYSYSIPYPEPGYSYKLSWEKGEH